MRKSAYLQITRKCNSECIFCSNPQFEKDFSFYESKKKILDFKKEGISEITLTGGEPTIVDFLPELVAFIRSAGLDVKMISNGVNLYNYYLTKRLYDSGLRKVTISFHSCFESVADKLSQREGNFRKTVMGIRNLLKVGCEVEINSTINYLNCNYLVRNAYFIVKNFPKIRHFIFNNLDPGLADSKLKSRAGENPWIVPRFMDFELELHKTLRFLRKYSKTFRVERVPLCYMVGFEEYSTETRKIIKNERYICSFLDEDRPYNVQRVTPADLRQKVDCCGFCNFNNICGGIDIYYLKIHGGDEIYPVFGNPDEVIRKVKNG